ncbi:hypothetical protein FNV43_RR21093 [Rhamnella rubrinervis]|uniref:Transmembrane protein 45A n=1 Tax=Rhamnella rubrinervis TaxID=2594499 RepID=A0A8K0E122_9ROSA|nr:hypothetical protein FNV43_RR21093 [Rhamnella rubrinervis]
MGTLVGHVLPGLGFLLIGLWHLFNHIKLHALHPNSYTTRTWFPFFKFKYLELYLIMGGATASVAMELFVGPTRHQPFDTDGTIPSNHLHNFEHSLISMTIFVYAALAVVLDRTRAKARHELTEFLVAVAFAQELFLFHVHSTDHQGLEGQYHLLLQFLIFVSFTTALMGIGFPKSFLVFFVRSLSICFQGVWFIVLGIILYTPSLLPKGCAIYYDDGHLWVRAPMMSIFTELILDDQVRAADESEDDVESQKKIYGLGASKNLSLLEKSALLPAETEDCRIIAGK